MEYFPLGEAGLTCPPFQALMTPTWLFGPCDSFGRLFLCCGGVAMMCAGGKGGVGDFLGAWCPLGALTWLGLAQRRLPTVANVHWSGARAPWILRCTGVWRAPTWWLFYYWLTHTSSSKVAATWWTVDWLSYSGFMLPPHPAVHPPRQQRGRSTCAAGGMPPGTSVSSPSPPPAGTSPVFSLRGSWHQCFSDEASPLAIEGTEMVNLALQPSQYLERSRGSRPYRMKRVSCHSCAPSSVPFTVDGCTIRQAPVFVAHHRQRAPWTYVYILKSIFHILYFITFYFFSL